MTGGRTLVAVKLHPVARAQIFVVADGTVDQRLQAGEPVLVETDAGPAFGTIVPQPSEVSERHLPVSGDAHHVVRRASPEDVVARLQQQQYEREAFRLAVMKVREHGLAMKLTRVERAFDGSRLLFYFTADGRVDFRDLIKELAAELRIRIELRQIGVRDEAKMLGGYGTCGRPLCCTTFLSSFEPISIKMAKQQDLSLNPSKLSGLCGRLKCCLRYELPNAKGTVHGGCGSEGGCDNPGGCGTGGCSSGGCDSCKSQLSGPNSHVERPAEP